jgi:DNA polymerase-3 subunit epsilon
MREIVFDTETTGLDPFTGHRVVEIGCIELMNGIPSGQTFHCYINPERDMPAEAFAVHGLSADFLKTHPCFAEIVDDFLAFVADAPLIAHNAAFDLGFLNAELDRAGRAVLPRERLIDTLLLARRRFPGTSNRLDDLCQRFGIDNSRRTKHGALLDAELLAEVYLELTGARQAQLGLAQMESAALRMQRAGALTRPTPLISRVSDAARAAHRAFIETLGAAAIWRDYLEPVPETGEPLSDKPARSQAIA